MVLKNTVCIQWSIFKWWSMLYCSIVGAGHVGYCTDAVWCGNEGRVQVLCVASMPRAWLAVFQIVYLSLFGTWYRSHYWRPVIHIWSLFRGGQGNHWQGVGCLFGFSFFAEILTYLWFLERCYGYSLASMCVRWTWGETRPFFCIGSSILATGTWGGRIFHSFQCMCCSWWVAASRETCLRDVLRLGVSCEAEV